MCKISGFLCPRYIGSCISFLCVEIRATGDDDKWPKRDVMMKERGVGGRWSALFPAGYGERRMNKGAEGEGVLTRKDKGRGDEEKGGKERGGELVVTAG